MSKKSNWQDFSEQLIRYSKPDLWLDLSQMRLPKDMVAAQKESIERALLELNNIESGEKVNTDEDKDKGGRCVGHYWLRNPDLAPNGLGTSIMRKIAEIKAFSSGIHNICLI